MVYWLWRQPSTLKVGSTVKQKNRVRPIDDYKASLVNFAATQNEGVAIHTISHSVYDRLLDEEWLFECQRWLGSQVLGLVGCLQALMKLSI